MKGEIVEGNAERIGPALHQRFVLELEDEDAGSFWILAETNAEGGESGEVE